MDFILNTEELALLYGLPHIQQLAYLRGIRPYMDVKTGLVGIKRRISYQSISEQLYVEPHQGIKSQSFSRDQLRRAMSGLARAGVITVQSDGMQLILKCELATRDYFVQNKAAINPPQKAITKPPDASLENTGLSRVEVSKADIGEPQEAAIPLIKNNNYIIFLLPKFEKFWDLYPLKKSKQKAWEAYQAIKPNDELVARINSALQQQIQFHQQQQSFGQWIAAWKYPANWLTQHCWEDEIQTHLHQEKKHAVHEAHYAKQQAGRDPLWDSYKAGLESESEFEAEDDNNIINFGNYQKKSQTY